MFHHNAYLKRQSYTWFLVAAVSGIAALALFIIPGVTNGIGYTNTIAENSAETIEMQSKLEGLRSTSRSLKEQYIVRAQNFIDQIRVALPTKAQRTEVARELELIASNISQFDIKSISFGKAKKEKGSDHSTVAISVQAHATFESMQQFFKTVENSGPSLAEPSRFYSINSGSISIAERYDSRLQAGPITLNVTLDSFYSEK